jgi:hypothetical protein
MARPAPTFVITKATMPHEITNHSDVLDAIRRTDNISELVEEKDGKFKYESDLEVIAYGRNYTGKKVGPYAHLLVYEAGEEIIHQGDWGGNTFFFGVEGDLDVYVKDQAGRQKWVDTQKPGKSFGEMSVLAGVPRTATISVPVGGKATVLMVERPALRLLRKLPKFGQSLDKVYRNNGLRRTVDDVLDLVDAPLNAGLVKRLSEAAQFKIYRSLRFAQTASCATRCNGFFVNPLTAQSRLRSLCWTQRAWPPPKKRLRRASWTARTCS